MTTPYQAYREAQGKLKEALFKAYEGILPKESLEKANPWYDNHLRTTSLALLESVKEEVAGREGIELIEADRYGKEHKEVLKHYIRAKAYNELLLFLSEQIALITKEK